MRGSPRLSRPLPDVSTYARRYVDEPVEGDYEDADEGADGQPSPRSASQPLLAKILAMQADARVRVREHGAWMWRTALAVLFWGWLSLSILHGGWSTTAMVLAIVLGLKWSYHFYEWRCARFESAAWPDV